MTMITDFYQFKYSKSSYYIDMFVNRMAISNIEEALDERLSDLSLTKDSACAYMRLKELFQDSRKSTSLPYAEVKINKCYLKYIRNLNDYFINRSDYATLKVLSDYLQAYSITDDDANSVSMFNKLDEDARVRILSSI
ncbi:hypothetical protein CHF27_005020 [Romboutsia maritimum]|uniref:Uncharacterized protein n=1 Tax=Romboutsia maritimum TaxID=2020948 RepID=A0A371IU08_9FIRM|nr:hypothetical protein [Romboutsia maritimum]RDY23945.1 hypothetical protein CHF27_005020 [Romboutsia maritimum]